MRGESIKAALSEAGIAYDNWTVNIPGILSNGMNKQDAEKLAAIITDEFKQTWKQRTDKLMDALFMFSGDVVNIVDRYDDPVIKPRVVKDGDVYRVLIDGKELHECLKDPERVKSFMTRGSTDAASGVTASSPTESVVSTRPWGC